MFNRKQKEIDNLNARCVELARTLREKADELRIQKHNNYEIIKENEKVRNENADLRCENDDLAEAVKRKIIELSDVTGNLQITH